VLPCWMIKEKYSLGWVPILLGMLLTGCSSLKPADFAGSKTIFEPDTYFLGHVQSWGVTENRAGQPHSHFTTDCFGKRDAEGDVTINHVSL
jgi:hypothetical protein